jgi:hypothetical protein
MRNLTLQFGLFSVCAFNLVPLSAQAQLTINNTQNSAISGNNNQVTQVINQTIIYRPRNSSNRSFLRRENKNKDKEDRGNRRGWNHRHREGDRERDREFHK